MLLIPGWLIAILTFPGVMIHELAHMLACKLAHLKVLKVCYFQLENPAGYVIHEQAGTWGQAFLVATAPFIFNTLAAITIFSIATLISTGTVVVVLFWLGISIGAHSFPSNEDSNILWGYSKIFWKQNILAILGFPLVILIKIANVLSFFWFDFIYAFLLAAPFFAMMEA